MHIRPRICTNTSTRCSVYSSILWALLVHTITHTHTHTHRPNSAGWAGSPEVAISMTVIERRLIYLPPFFSLQQQKTKAVRGASPSLLLTVLISLLGNNVLTGTREAAWLNQSHICTSVRAEMADPPVCVCVCVCDKDQSICVILVLIVPLHLCSDCLPFWNAFLFLIRGVIEPQSQRASSCQPVSIRQDRGFAPGIDLSLKDSLAQTICSLASSKLAQAEPDTLLSVHLTETRCSTSHTVYILSFFSCSTI